MVDTVKLWGDCMENGSIENGCMENGCTKNEGPHFDSSVWRHLPSDKTMSEFRRDYQKATGRQKTPSVTWVKELLTKIDPASESNQIIKTLFRRRFEDDYEHNTYPVLIPWETAHLLSTILETGDSGKKLKGEKFASEILINLAKKIAAAGERDITDDYVYLQYLSNGNVRDKMLQEFKKLFIKRLDLLRDYIFDAEAGVDIEMLWTALGRLDVLISIFDDRRPQLKSDTQALTDIYESLLSLREQLIPQKGRQTGVDKYTWSEIVDMKLTGEMRGQIENTRRSPKGEEVSSFLDNYRKYLMQHLSENTQEEIQNFWENFKKLHNYFYQKDDSDRFEEKVRKELYDFAINIFKDLEKADTIELEYTGFVPEFAASSYVAFELAGIHRNIHMIIHKQLWILKVVNSYLYFLNINEMGYGVKLFLKNIIRTFQIQVPETECKKYLLSVFNKIEAVTKIIQELYQELADKYPVLASLDFNNPDSIGRFRDEYKTHASVIFGDGTNEFLILQGTKFENYSLFPDCYYKKLFFASSVLTIVCKYVVAIEIGEAVPLLVEQYNKLRRRLDE